MGKFVFQIQTLKYIAFTVLESTACDLYHCNVDCRSIDVTHLTAPAPAIDQGRNCWLVESQLDHRIGSKMPQMWRHAMAVL